VHDKARSGRSLLVNDDLVRKVNERVRDDRRFTVSDLYPALSSDFKDDIVSSHLGYRRPHSMRVYKHLCSSAISASIMAANMWKNGLKNVESVNNKILYGTLLDLFLQRNGTYFLNKPRTTSFLKLVTITTKKKDQSKKLH